MPLYYDVSEARSTSKLPESVIKYGKPFSGLEKLTGADFIVTPKLNDYDKARAMKDEEKSYKEIARLLDKSPSTIIKLLRDSESAIAKWCLSGALLVQRKSGLDYIASIGPRLNNAICEMLSVGTPYMYQRIILVTGNFTRKGTMLYLNGKKCNVKYNQFEGATSAIKYKGAIVVFRSSDACILPWIKAQEKQLLLYKKHEVKEIVSPTFFPHDHPVNDDPLQLMRKVTDARLAICQMPGWGSGKTNVLYEYVKKCLAKYYDYPPVPLLHLLAYATAFETTESCKGIGKKLIQNARDYVGLRKGEYLAISKNNVTVQQKKEK